MLALRNACRTLLLATPLLASVAGAHAFAPPTAITIESQLVDGKLQWLPASTTLRNSSAVTLTVINRLKEPEDFAIPGLVEAVVIAPGEARVLTFDADISGTYYLKSSNHPGHGTAKVIILR